MENGKRVPISQKKRLIAGNFAAAQNHSWLWSQIACAERNGSDASAAS